MGFMTVLIKVAAVAATAANRGGNILVGAAIIGGTKAVPVVDAVKAAIGEAERIGADATAKAADDIRTAWKEAKEAALKEEEEKAKKA